MEENNKKDHLMNYIEDTEKSSNNPIDVNLENTQQGGNVTKRVSQEEFQSLSSNWQNIPLNVLPYGKFYQTGTNIFIKPLSSKEIQSFSVVNEESEYDVNVKLNLLFKTCVQIKFLDGSYGTYRDLMDGDRQTIAILLSRLSAKNGRRISQKATTQSGDEIEIEMIPANYVYLQQEEWLDEFFNEETKVYEFSSSDGRSFKLAPPTIGITEDVNNYALTISLQSQGKKYPDFSFLKCIPYIKAGNKINSLSFETLEQEEFNFSKMNDDIFVAIDDAINYLDFGVEKLQKTLDSGETVTAPFRYPNGARSLFIVPNAFRQFVGK